MNGKLKRLLIATAASAALLAPVAALAQTSSPQITYKTSLHETTPLALGGYYPGTLKLTVTPDGTVQGWYVPDYSGSPILVTGSDTQGTYWLSFGNGNFQISAKKQPDGTLVGSAQRIAPLTQAFPQTYNFVATPATS